MGLLDRWTDGERESPEPLEGPIRGTVLVGIAVWLVLFLGQLPFYGWYVDHGHEWFIWTCAAGVGLGLFGLWYVRARDRALQRAAEKDPGTSEA